MWSDDEREMYEQIRAELERRGCNPLAATRSEVKEAVLDLWGGARAREADDLVEEYDEWIEQEA